MSLNETFISLHNRFSITKISLLSSSPRTQMEVGVWSPRSRMRLPLAPCHLVEVFFEFCFWYWGGWTRATSINSFCGWDRGVGWCY